MADYTRRDMLAALTNAGLERGDIVFLHAGLGLLGHPQGVSNQEELNGLFLDCMEDILGPQGDILVPAYTYSLCWGGVFDAATTPSTVGPFPEFFRKQPGVVRSQEPILSVCGKGPGTAALLGDLSPTSYGEGSLYWRLARSKAKICTVGLPLNWATFLHHIEEMVGVPYRYRKVFRGEMIDPTYGRKTVSWTYSVRLWAKNAEPAPQTLAAMAVADGVCRKTPLGRSAVFCIGADAYFDFAAAQMRTTPWIAARGPAAEPLALELERVPTEPHALSLPDAANLEELADALTPLPRNNVSDGYNAALAALARQMPMTMHEYPTGLYCAGRVVPERWGCTLARLEAMGGETVFSEAGGGRRVMSHSHAFDGVVRLKELMDHLHVHPLLEDAIPIVSNDGRREWGLCCTQRERSQLRDDNYRVTIRSAFSFGTMRVGEAVLGGSGDGVEIVLCARLSGPGQFNDGLSGALAGLEIMRMLCQRGSARHTIRLLLVPDITGLLAWDAEHRTKGRRCGLFLNLLASPGPLRVLCPTDAKTDCAALSGALLSQTGTEAWEGGAVSWLLDGSGLSFPLVSAFRCLSPGQRDSPYREHLSSADTPGSFCLDAVKEASEAVVATLIAMDAWDAEGRS